MGPTSEPSPDPNAALAAGWGQKIWFPLSWRIDPRWGKGSAIARAVQTWLQGHVRSMEAAGLTGPSLENIEAGIRAAETEGQRLLAWLEAEFPAGVGPATDEEAQAAVERIVARLRGTGSQSLA
jgi:hypothetical protein